MSTERGADDITHARSYRPTACVISSAPGPSPVVTSRIEHLCSHMPLKQKRRPERRNPGLDIARFSTLKRLRERVVEVKGLEWFDVPTCAEFMGLYKHKSTSETRLQPLCCHERGWCPYCAVTYGEGLAVSTFRQLRAYMEAVRGVHQVKAFTPVFTHPDVVSSYLGNLVEMQDKEAVTSSLNELTRVITRTLRKFFKAECGVKMAWHWWHSSDPLAVKAVERNAHPWHFHAHCIIPNVRCEEGVYSILRQFGRLEPQEIEKLRSVYKAELLKTRVYQGLGFTDDNLDLPNLNWRFVMSWKQLQHRCKYDYRHPMQDLEAYASKSEIESSDLAWFINTCEKLQKIRKVRASGLLAPSKISEILEEVDTEEEWERLNGFTARVIRFDDQGVFITMYDAIAGTQTNQYWEAEHVRLFAVPVKQYAIKT